MDLSKLTAAIITMSDSRTLNNQKADLSGQAIREMLEKENYEIISYQLISDDFDQIKKTLIATCEQNPNLILTTGGTGLSPRDNTPEATRAILEKEVPGISEAIRYHSLQITPRAMLSRGVSGICQQSLIINLPGSPKAVRENLTYILPTLRHGIEILNQVVKECGSGDD